MKLKRTLGLLAILSIAACAHTENSATYNAAAETGFSFKHLDNSNYKVYFKGEKNQSAFQVNQKLILGASQLAKLLGYDYFYLNAPDNASHVFSDIGVIDGVGQLLAIVAVGLFNSNNYDPHGYSPQLPYPNSHNTKAIEYEINVASGEIIMGKGDPPMGAYIAGDEIQIRY